MIIVYFINLTMYNLELILCRTNHDLQSNTEMNDQDLNKNKEFSNHLVVSRNLELSKLFLIQTKYRNIGISNFFYLAFVLQGIIVFCIIKHDN